MNRTLENKVAIVTGAGRGIGRAIALKFATHGARVVLNDLDAEVAEHVADEIRSMKGAATVVAGSVSATDFGERVVQAAVQSYGRLDIIVNNAGYTWDNVIQKMTDEQWYAMIDVHLTAPFRILRAAQPVIRRLVAEEDETGRPSVRKVVNISSVAGVFGNAGQLNYSAGKAGIIGMTQTLAKEWGRLRTTVNCVAFGLIKTRMTGNSADGGTAKIDGHDIRVGVNPDLLAMMERTIPLGRAGTPEDAANAVYLLAIPESDYVSGQTLLCTGGLTGI
jgi:3-oxoacyl-[acyl-carrier protein] reductase